MAEMIDDFIEIDEAELTSGIDLSKLEESTSNTSVEEKEEKTIIPIKEEKASQEQEDLIEVDETSIIQSNQEDVDPTVESEETEDSAFKAFTSLLRDKGVFPNMEDSDFTNVNDADDIVKLLNKQLGAINTSWKENYINQIIPNLIKDGHITKQQVVNKSISYTKEDIIGNEDNAKKVVQAYYTSKNIPEDQVNTIVDNVLDYEEEALKLLPQLEEAKANREKVIADKFKANEEAILQNQNSFNDNLRKTVEGYKEFIPGRVLTEEDKEDVVNRIPTILNKINTESAKYFPILAFLDKYGFMEGNMDKLIKEAGTKTVSDFEKILTNKKRKTGSAKSTPSNSGGGLRGTSTGIYK